MSCMTRWSRAGSSSLTITGIGKARARRSMNFWRREISTRISRKWIQPRHTSGSLEVSSLSGDTMRIGTLVLVGTVLVLETHSPRRLRAQDTGSAAYVLDSLRRATLTGAAPDQRQTAAVLYAAKGEVQAFQIVINGGASGLDGVDASLSSPLTTAEGTALPAQAATFYREHFVSISNPS